MIRGILISFIGGIFTFISPCVLPLIPAYIFYITGLKADEEKNAKVNYLFKIFLFILGFSLVYIALGAITGALSQYAIRGVKNYLNKILGVLVVIFGIHYMGIIKIFFLNTEKKFELPKITNNYLGPIVMGMVFAAGWSPCVGPILGTILALVATGGSFLQGIFFLTIYSLSLGLPLVLIALFFNFFQPVITFLKKHSEAMKIVSGIFLIAIGVLIFFDIFTYLPKYFSMFSIFLEENLAISNIFFSVILLVMGILLFIPTIKNKKLKIVSIIFALIFIILGILNLLYILPLLKIIIDYLLSSYEPNLTF